MKSNKQYSHHKGDKNLSFFILLLSMFLSYFSSIFKNKNVDGEKLFLDTCFVLQ